ncbi:MAG: ABC transporter permease [Solirubrobacterales bacterium]
MKKGKGLIIPLILILIWWGASRFNIVNSYLLPSPERILDTSITLIKDGTLQSNVRASLFRVFVGFIITTAAAIPLAVLVSLHKNIYHYLKPFLEFMRHIPPISLIPILILWMGIGEASKLTIIILATFFPVFLNTVSGIINADEKLEEVGTVFNFSKKDILIRIIFPQALPSILVGLQLGLGYSWRSLIGAELVAASTGIGYMIIEAEQLSRPDIIIVGILIIGILGCLVDALFLKLTNKFLVWNRENGRYAGGYHKEAV